METLAAIALILVAAVAAFIRGKSLGKAKTEVNQQAEVLDSVKQAKEISDTISSMSADERRERMRKYTK